MKSLKVIGLSLLLALLSLPAAAQDTVAKSPQEICDAAPADSPASRQFQNAEQVLEPGVDYRAIFCTSAGAVYVDLFEQYAPITVNSFVFLSEQGFYNNSVFHRVMADFMAQGGDPVGSPSGTGGPGYQFEDEFVGFLAFDRPGLLAMANSGPGTNGSQFFITTAVTDWLNYKHTIFGDVLAGFDNVTAIQLCDPDCSAAPGTSLNTVVIITDAASVDAEVTADAPVTAGDFITGLEPLTSPEGLPADIQIVAEQTGTFTTDEVVASGNPDVAEDYAAFLKDHNHQFQIRLSVNNATCNDQYFFSSMSYTVDAYGSAEDAAAALQDERLDTINAASGFSRAESNLVLYTQDANDCNQAATTLGRLYLQRGRYLAVVEGVFPQPILASAPLDTFLAGNVAQLFEQFLGAAFRSELR